MTKFDFLSNTQVIELEGPGEVSSSTDLDIGTWLLRVTET